MRIVTDSEASTIKLGENIGKVLEPGDIISLTGDLGAGKTQLTKGIAAGLGVVDYVTSPTFIIVNEYEGRIPLYHFDVYRINDIQEMYEIGFDEYLFGKGVCVIEWGDIVSDLLPEKIIRINMKKIDDNIREISIEESKSFDFLREENK